jgi:hypothetical protein
MREQMLPLTLPSPPLGERDQNTYSITNVFSSLSPVAGGGQGEGDSTMNEHPLTGNVEYGQTERTPS